MSSFAELPELVGFFSYSREGDADSHGALSALRSRIQGELRQLLQNPLFFSQNHFFDPQLKRLRTRCRQCSTRSVAEGKLRVRDILTTSFVRTDFIAHTPDGHSKQSR